MEKILRGLAAAQAKRFGVDPKLVQALVTVESAWDEWAYRYEPAYAYLFKPEDFAKALGISKESERCFQKTSFGLMQIMGAAAREHGFSGQLGRLFIPETNLEYGIKHLLTLAQRYEKIEDQIAAYNAGSAKTDALTGAYRNQRYVDKVLKAYGPKP